MWFHYRRTQYCKNSQESLLYLYHSHKMCILLETNSLHKDKNNLDIMHQYHYYRRWLYIDIKDQQQCLLLCGNMLYNLQQFQNRQHTCNHKVNNFQSLNIFRWHNQYIIQMYYKQHIQHYMEHHSQLLYQSKQRTQYYYKLEILQINK